MSIEFDLLLLVSLQWLGIAAWTRGVIVSPSEYAPPLSSSCRKITILAIFTDKSRPTQFRILKPSKENSRESPEFPNQNLRQIGEGVPEL